MGFTAAVGFSGITFSTGGGGDPGGGDPGGGDPGGPTPDANWVDWPSLQNGWDTFPSNPPQYKRDISGTVALRGYLLAGASSTGTLICTFPEGRRPAANVVLEPVGDGFTTLRIEPDGEIRVHANGFSEFMVLDGLEFQANP